jgi:nucleoside-diphosphate-sugar epimerase
MTKILITGAPGRVSNVLGLGLKNEYDLTFVAKDSESMSTVDQTGERVWQLGDAMVVYADCADLESFRRVMEGQDVLIHLAHNPEREHASNSKIIDNRNHVSYANSLFGVDNTSIGRVIGALTVHMETYRNETKKDELYFMGKKFNPDSGYGFNKEIYLRLGRIKEVVEFVGLGFGGVPHVWEVQNYFNNEMDMEDLRRVGVAYPDVISAVRSAIERELPERHDAYYVVSDNPVKLFRAGDEIWTPEHDSVEYYTRVHEAVKKGKGLEEVLAGNF